MIKTTYEMDGLLTQEDIDNRHKVMMQCRKCTKWTQQNTQRSETNPCMNEIKDKGICGANDFDIQSTKSLRTYNPVTDNKRKVK